MTSMFRRSCAAARGLGIEPLSHCKLAVPFKGVSVLNDPMAQGLNDSMDQSVRAAYAECRRLARRHYENFPVASYLVPRAKRDALAAIYAFARCADDFADEPGVERRLEALADWRQRLHKCYRGDSPGLSALPGRSGDFRAEGPVKGPTEGPVEGKDDSGFPRRILKIFCEPSSLTSASIATGISRPCLLTAPVRLIPWGDWCSSFLATARRSYSRSRTRFAPPSSLRISGKTSPWTSIATGFISRWKTSLAVRSPPPRSRP